MNERDFPVIAFELIRPQPANIEKGGCSGEHDEDVVCWYEWNIRNWGTKWDAYDHDQYVFSLFRSYETGKVEGRVDLRFTTAWSAPTPIFKAIQDRWGVQVVALTQDEGGWPDVEFGDTSSVLRKVVTFEFDHWGGELVSEDEA